MNVTWLNDVWFILVGVLFTGYAMLDGFDLGVGTLHLMAKTDEHRRLLLNAIGPVWDGNEVWLVTGGGALFAAFPEAYATVFSGFYLAFILLLLGLIFRAIAIEFRSKRPEAWWRQMWDMLFSIGSILSSFLVGVAMGNVIWGVPLDGNHEFAGDFLDLLNPYSILMGITTVSLFAMHGAIYILLKTEGELQVQAKSWAINCVIAFVLLYVITTLATLLYVPHMAQPVVSRPWLFALPLLNILAVANIPREIHRGREWNAFLSSCAAMAALMALFGVGMFPYLVVCHANPLNSLDIYNAASSPKTLGIMLVIACLGVPIVLAYTACIYWIFRGKVVLDHTAIKWRSRGLLSRALRFQPAYRVAHERRGVLQSELFLDVPAMNVYGLGTEVQFLGDFAGALSLSNHLEDFEFAVTQRLNGRIRAARLFRGEIAQNPIRHRRTDVSLSPEHVANRDQQVFTPRLLHDIAPGACAQAAFGIDDFVMHRDDENR